MKYSSLALITQQFEEKGRFYFNGTSDYSNLGGKPWFRNLEADCGLITFVNRVRSGHTQCREHLVRKNLISSAECNCGEPIQSVEHLIFNCPNIAREAEILISKLKKIDIFIEDRIEHLIFRNDKRIL